MKNHKLCLCALAALLLLLLMAGSAMASSGTFGVIYGTDTLNLRAQGSSSSQWLGSCTRGTWVEINGSQNNFYYVRTPDGKTGYMSKNYIDQVIDESDFVWTALVTNSNGGAFLNFRAQPNYNAQVLGISTTACRCTCSAPPTAGTASRSTARQAMCAENMLPTGAVKTPAAAL